MTLALHMNHDELFKLGCSPDSPVDLFWAKFAERRPTAVPDMEKVCRSLLLAALEGINICRSSHIQYILFFF